MSKRLTLPQLVDRTQDAYMHPMFSGPQWYQLLSELRAHGLSDELVIAAVHSKLPRHGSDHYGRYTAAAVMYYAGSLAARAAERSGKGWGGTLEDGLRFFGYLEELG